MTAEVEPAPVRKINSLNLISRAPKESSPPPPPGFYAALVLEILSVFFALVLGYAAREYLFSRLPLAPVLMVLVGFSTLASLATLLVANGWRRAAVVVLEVLGFSGMLYWGEWSGWFLGVTLAAVFFFLWGEFSARREIRSSLYLRFFRCLHPKVGKITTAVILAMVILLIPRWQARGSLIPPEKFQLFFGFMADTVQNLYPELRLNSTFGELTEDLARYQLTGNTTFYQLPQDIQARALEQVSGEVLKKVSGFLGREISPTESISAVLYRLVLEKITDWQASLGLWFIILWAAVVFFLARGVGFLVAWFSAIVAFLLFQLLLATGFLEIVGEDKMQEVARFKG